MASKLFVIPSEEQRLILAKYKSNHNICIRAVAGAGKTTTLLLLARDNPHQRILILSYNRALQEDTNAKIKSLQMNNVEASTIHSAAGKFYGKNIYNDSKLLECRDIHVKEEIMSLYDAIFVDEVQDLTYALLHFINEIICDKTVVLVGDPMQCIYQYNGATSEYLLNASHYFNNGRNWEELFLTESYRCGPQIAKFLNKHIKCEHGDIEMIGKGPDGKVSIIVKDTHVLLSMLTDAVDRVGINNVVVIAPSVKRDGRSKWIYDDVITKFTKKTSYDYEIADADSPKGTQYTNDRLVIGTFHSMKGLEREEVIVIVGEDDFTRGSYWNWNIEDKVPYPIYVAMTRAKSHLIWFIKGDCRNVGMRGINLDTIEHDVDKIYGTLSMGNKIHPMGRYKAIHDDSFTETIKFRDVLDEIAMLNLGTHQAINFIPHYSKNINRILSIPYFSKDSKDSKDHTNLQLVHQYYGIAVPAFVEYSITSKYTKLLLGLRETILDLFLRNNKHLGVKKIPELERLVREGGEFNKKISLINDKILHLVKNEEMSTEELLNILHEVANEEKYRQNVEFLRSIIAIETKSPRDIMKIVCLSEMIRDTSVASKLGDLSWISDDFLLSMSERLAKYITDKISVPKFEIDTLVRVRHPILKHIDTVSKKGDFILVHTRECDLIRSYLDIKNEEDPLQTRDAISLSNRSISVAGRIDCMNQDRTIYEFKLTNSIEDKHRIQTMAYMATEKIENGYIFNILTGEEEHISMPKENHDSFLSIFFRKVTNWKSVSTFEYGLQFDTIINTDSPSSSVILARDSRPLRFPNNKETIPASLKSDKKYTYDVLNEHKNKEGFEKLLLIAREVGMSSSTIKNYKYRGKGNGKSELIKAIIKIQNG